MIKYLDNFPKIVYDGRLITDLSTRIDTIDSIMNKEGVTFKYELSSGEKPEDIAFDVYGNTQYHWIVLLANRIQDPFYDWYLSDAELLAKAEIKYDDVQGIHHCEVDGVKYREDPQLGHTVLVTNLEFEERLNDELRFIKVIYPEFLDIIIDEFDRLTEA